MVLVLSARLSVLNALIRVKVLSAVVLSTTPEKARVSIPVPPTTVAFADRFVVPTSMRRFAPLPKYIESAPEPLVTVVAPLPPLNVEALAKETSRVPVKPVELTFVEDIAEEPSVLRRVVAVAPPVF